MPRLGEFTKNTHADLSAQADLHTPKLHADDHLMDGLDVLLHRRILKPTLNFLGGTITMAEKRVYLLALEIPFNCSIDGIIPCWSNPVAGNVRAVVYEDVSVTPEGGDVLVESASIAKAGTYRYQKLTLAETALTRGIVWLGIVSDEGTSKFHRAEYGAYGPAVLRGISYDIGTYGALTDPCPTLTARDHPAYLMASVVVP